MTDQLWKGVFISEALEDPRILYGFTCTKIKITSDQLPLDDKGTKGRWHMYWIQAMESDFDLFANNMKYNGYGHFWKDNTIQAIFQKRIFELDKHDKDTWSEAIAFGLSQNIEAGQLDFLTED